MRNREWALLVIAAAEGRALSPVHLQKALFLLSKNLTAAQLQRESLYDFRPYDYGPFDSAVYRDAESLEGDGFITISPEGRNRTYSISAQGLTEAGRLRSSLDAKAIGYLDHVVNWVLSQSFGDLVRAIYKSYPEMREKSVFRG
jgi:uncharacterized protein YwgA